MQVDCLLGNYLEHSILKEVELRSLAEMLGLPESVLMTTWSMAAHQGSRKDLEPETVGQVPTKKSWVGPWETSPSNFQGMAGVQPRG